jgi:hypothetical protein
MGVDDTANNNLTHGISMGYRMPVLNDASLLP